MEKKTLGYAVLGLGIGMAHADAAYASPNASLVAVCDLDQARLERAAKKYEGVTLYTSFDSLLSDNRVDIISICLPSAMHADFAVRAMEAGKHVLVEKPLDITPERAALIESAQKRTGKICGVVHQNRFNASMTPIRDAITTGRMGKLILGSFGVKWYREQAYYDANGGWRGTWEMDGGGSLMNQAVHTVDLMQWLMGDVASVTSSMGVFAHDIDTEDMTASLIRFKNGASATFVSTTCAYPGISTEIMLYGTEGSVEADGDALKLFKMKDDPDETDETAMLSLYGDGNFGLSVQEPDRLFGHAYVVEDMISAVLTGRDPQVTPSEALKAIRIVCAIYESAKTGKTVTFP